MTDKEMTTVEEINARQAKYERFSDCSVDEMNELFDMARRFTTEIPKLEAELRDSVQLSDFHLETCRMRERSIKEYRERLATATAQVEQLTTENERQRKALKDIADGEGLYDMQALEYKKIAIEALNSNPDACIGCGETGCGGACVRGA